MDKLTFQELQTALTGVAGIRYVDFDLGQLEQEAPPVSFPCALIGLGGSPVVANGAGVDQVNLNLTVRVAFRLYERTSSITNATYQGQALEHLDKLRDIHAALNGLAGTNFSALQRTQYWSNEKRADIRVYQASYGTLLEDDGTTSTGDPGTATPNYVPWTDLMPASPDLELDGEVAGYEATDQPPKLLPVP